jgi:hypothetical protein
MISTVLFRIRMFLCLPDPHPDPLIRGTDPNQDPYQGTYQIVTDSQHCQKVTFSLILFDRSDPEYGSDPNFV